MRAINRISLILVIALALTLVACGQIDKPVNETNFETIQTPGQSLKESPLDSELVRERLSCGPDDRLAFSPVIATVPADALLIAHGLVIDGTGGEPIPDGLVAVQDNRILAVGPFDAFEIALEADIIDVSGKTILPGIINAHIHHGYDPVTRRHLLVEGVTSVCDLGSSLRCMPHFDREDTPQGEIAARGFKAGPMLTAPGGYPGTVYGFSWHYEVETPEKAKQAVLELISRGADVIKVALEPGPQQAPWPMLSQTQVDMIVATAHAYGLPVRAHVRQAAVLDIALDGGVDVIEHLPVPFRSSTQLKQLIADDALSLTAQPELAAQLDRMVEQDVTLVPTLSPNVYIIEKCANLSREEQSITRNFLLEMVDYVHQQGGTVALGNDFGSPGVERGMPLEEMAWLAAAGLSPQEIIEAGTQHAARVSGQQHDLGTLEAGKLADLIVVDGNPLTDITVLDHIDLIIKDGEIVFRQTQF